MNPETDIIISLISRIREKAGRFITSELAARGLGDLKPIHGDLLLALFKYKNPTMTELTAIVDRKKSTVTTLVNKLVQLGYASKIRDHEDYRSFRISLTNKGKALKSDLADISQHLLSKVYKEMPVEERKRIVKGLDTINRNW